MPIYQSLEQNFCKSQPDLQYRQRTYNATLRRVRVTIVAEGKSNSYNIF
jgi:hypothetical protein